MNLVEMYNYKVLNPERIIDRYLTCFSFSKSLEPSGRFTIAGTIQLKPIPELFSEKLIELFNGEKLTLRSNYDIFILYKPYIISFMDSNESVTIVLTAQDIHRFGVNV